MKTNGTKKLAEGMIALSLGIGIFFTDLSREVFGDGGILLALLLLLTGCGRFVQSFRDTMNHTSGPDESAGDHEDSQQPKRTHVFIRIEWISFILMLLCFFLGAKWEENIMQTIGLCFGAVFALSMILDVFSYLLHTLKK